MSVQRELKAAFLVACLDLDLTDQERDLLREVAHYYALGQEAEWGARNSHREQEVRDLFQKCSTR